MNVRDLVTINKVVDLLNAIKDKECVWRVANNLQSYGKIKLEETKHLESDMCIDISSKGDVLLKSGWQTNYTYTFFPTEEEARAYAHKLMSYSYDDIVDRGGYILSAYIECAKVLGYKLNKDPVAHVLKSNLAELNRKNNEATECVKSIRKQIKKLEDELAGLNPENDDFKDLDG